MTTRRQRQPRRARSAPLSRWIGTALALATLLAVAAPLVHAHLDAAASAAVGLCGEHGDEAPGAPAAEHCPLCLASRPGHAALALAAPPLRLAGSPASPAAASAPLARSAPERGPGAPRAPPLV